MKNKETLEEAVNNFKKTDVYINEIKQEQERSYSEEEKERILSNFIKIVSGPAEITGFKVPDNYEKEFLNSLEKMKKEELKNK